jgi:simple sugar transport system substrate-binding protein
MLPAKRVWTILSVLVLAATLLGACGPRGSSSGDEFVFGIIMVGPHNDRGWSEAHYNGGKYAEQAVANTRMIDYDKLNPADRQGVTLQQVVDDMVNEGAKLIFTTSDDFGADTDLAAAEHPDVKFVHISGDHVRTGRAPANVANYMGRMYYMKAVSGCAAALKTETGHIGYLGPLVNEETRRLAAAAYQGSRYCYETYRGKNADDLRFTVTWIGFWFNIPGVTLDPTEVTDNLINGGADVIISGIDTTEGLVRTGQRFDRGEQVWAIPYDYEGACAEKPEICLGVPYFNWGPKYAEIVRETKEGKFQAVWEWDSPDWQSINDHDKSTVGFIYGDALGAEDQKQVEAYIADLASNKVQIFAGPLHLQDGTLYLNAGQVATDEQIWYMPQLLRGMEGASF